MEGDWSKIQAIYAKALKSYNLETCFVGERNQFISVIIKVRPLRGYRNFILLEQNTTVLKVINNDFRPIVSIKIPPIYKAPGMKILDFEISELKQLVKSC